MRAAVLRAFGEPLEIADVADPIPEADEVLVRVHAAGVCGTDLKIVAGALPGTPLPIVPGHEIAGELAADAGDLRAGQRVAVYFYDPCGKCRFCLAGEESLCPRSRRLGFERDGGLAELVCVRRRNVLPFGAELRFERAATAMDAVLSPWHALHVRAPVSEGATVVVAGAGGLGLCGVQIARAAGARVAALDPVAEHRQAAMAAGAELALAPTEVDDILEWADGGADVALETSGTRSGFAAAAAALRRGGRLVCCGYCPGVEYGLDSARLVLEELTVLGSRAGSRADAVAALAAVDRGEVVPPIAARLPLERVNDALAALAAGAPAGRFVIQLRT
jgi:propanol-preferring alcohol dehydrogenase